MGNLVVCFGVVAVIEGAMVTHWLGVGVIGVCILGKVNIAAVLYAGGNAIKVAVSFCCQGICFPLLRAK